MWRALNISERYAYSTGQEGRGDVTQGQGDGLDQDSTTLENKIQALYF